MKRLSVLKKEQPLYLETAKQRIAEVLFIYPEKEFSLSDLAKEAKVKKSNIGSILSEMHQKGFIEITKLSTIWRIKSNLQHPHFTINKIIHNLALIYNSGLVEFLNNYFGHPKSITLFGSFRRGEDLSSSDVDIAIEKDDIKNYEIVRLRELSAFEKTIKRKIQVHLFSRKTVDLNVFNNIANGIVLCGFLEVKP